MTYSEAIALLASMGPKGRMTRNADGSPVLRLAVGQEARKGRYVMGSEALPVNLSRGDVAATDWVVEDSEGPFALGEPEATTAPTEPPKPAPAAKGRRG